VHSAAVNPPPEGGGGFDALFRRLYPPLFRYLNRMTGDSDAADDMAQEAFVRLLGRNMPEDEARLWVFTVATNLLRDRGRTLRRRERLMEASDWRPSSPAAPDEALERARTVGRVRNALDQVPARDRQMLLMREEGFRYDEIAQAAGVAPGSVGTLLARAARRFAAAYQPDAGQDDEALG
jgi:RNA polymerase sigma-70 factor, ECF subfamily